MPRRTNTMTARTNRAGNGRYTRSIKTAERDAKAAELRSRGWSLDGIAAELGYASRGHVHDALGRAFAAIPYEGAEQARALDLLRIDRLIEWNWRVMLTPHPAHSNGKVVRQVTGYEREADGTIMRDADGKPAYTFADVADDAPGQASAREIRALVETRGKIIGYVAPVKSRVEVITEDVFDREIADVARQVAENDARTAAGTGTA